MRRSLLPFLTALWVSVNLAFSGLAVHAQMYLPDFHSQSRGKSVTAPAQPSYGGIGPLDSASEFIQRREEEDRERREIWERQRRIMENFTNIPDQLRESYFFKRADAPRYSR